MEVLVLDGKKYVKAAKAAKDLGYASDYVGQLCRKGLVSSRLIGRTWYVDPEGLSSHRVEKKRISRLKAREHAKKAIETARVTGGTKSPNVHKNIEIRYESDDQELIPSTRKLSVTSEKLPRELQEPYEEEGDSLEVLNQGEKIQMSGDLEVVDLTDTPVDADTVILTPRRIRGSSGRDVREIQSKNDEDLAESEPHISIGKTPVRKSFGERLREDIPVAHETARGREALDRGTEEDASLPVEKVAVPSLWGHVLFVTFLLLLVLATLPLYQTVSYSAESVGGIEVGYDFSMAKLLPKIQSKI